MSHLYTPLLVVHVLAGVLGLGSIASIILVPAERGGEQIPASISSLLRYSALSLTTMLVTGILLDLAARGAFHEYWWFRGSAILLVATGVLHRWARRTVRRAGSNGGGMVFGRVKRIAYGMCALIAAITMLMEVKPF